MTKTWQVSLRTLFTLGGMMLILSACGAVMKQADRVSEVKIMPIEMSPLPGKLNEIPLIHSNWPERIESPGLILSTSAGDSNAHLNHPVNGDFSLFLHHVVRTPLWDTRQMWIGILAKPQALAANHEPVRLDLKQGNVFLTRPDAPFVELPTLVKETQGKVFAGPGDRVATETLLSQSHLPATDWQFEPGAGQFLLFQWQVPTNPVFFIQQDNALSGLLHFASQQAVNISLVALYQTDKPSLQDYEAVLQSGQLAGPAENTATEYDPQADPKGLTGAFRYGRVAGIVQGNQWQAEIDIRLPLTRALGFPLASLYLKRLNTKQNQSGALISKVPGSAIESHGNYGSVYWLRLTLDNPTDQTRTLALALQQPVQVSAVGADFRVPPIKHVMFRGSVKVTYQNIESLHHLVLKQGEQAPAFFEANLAARSSEILELSLIYPADATPPQLLSLWESTSQNGTP